MVQGALEVPSWNFQRLHGRTFVHLSTSVHILKFLMVRRLNPSMSWTVRLRPPSTSVHLGQIIMVCHDMSSEFVHEVDGLSSSGRSPPSIYGKFLWSVVRIRPRDGQSICPTVHLRRSIKKFLVRRPNPSTRWTVHLSGRPPI